jgi:hypothetical protein
MGQTTRRSTSHAHLGHSTTCLITHATVIACSSVSASCAAAVIIETQEMRASTSQPACEVALGASATLDIFPAVSNDLICDSAAAAAAANVQLSHFRRLIAAIVV